MRNALHSRFPDCTINLLTAIPLPLATPLINIQSWIVIVVIHLSQASLVILLPEAAQHKLLVGINCWTKKRTKKRGKPERCPAINTIKLESFTLN